MEKLLYKNNRGSIFLTEKNGTHVIKKINMDRDNFLRIKKYGHLYDHKLLCCVLEMCPDERTMYLEYVKGRTLEQIFPFERRVSAAAEFFCAWIPGLEKADCSAKYGEIYYGERIRRIKKYISSSVIKQAGLEKIYAYYEKLAERKTDSGLYLLHGDAHNKNLIMQDNGRVKLVDLSPVAAGTEFEYSRFFENELYGVNSFQEFYYRYEFMRIAFGLEHDRILPALFVDSCYRMWQTLFIHQDDSEISKMKTINSFLMEMVTDGLEL